MLASSVECEARINTSVGKRSFAALLPIGDRPARTIPLRAFVFVIADEVNPFARKVVRKVMFPKGLKDAALVEKIMHPERYGFTPRDPSSPVSLGRHVLGRTDSKFVSASDRPRLPLNRSARLGGWGGAWAGAELCGTAGAALGIETGPGAIVTGAVGGLIGGAAGFFGADWIAHLVDNGKSSQ